MWNSVTWYSKLLAVVLFVGVLCLGFYLGRQDAEIKNISVSIPRASVKDLKTYTEPSGIYRFSFDPRFMVISGDDTKPTKDWRLNSTAEGILLTMLTIPRPYQPSTNFSEAKLTIGRSTDPSAIRDCVVVETWARTVASVTIDGYVFKKVSFSDAGAGNFYDTTSYRAVLDGDCYVIEYTVHSTNIGNYSPDQGIKEFDRANVQNELESAIQSSRFQLADN